MFFAAKSVEGLQVVHGSGAVGDATATVPLGTVGDAEDAWTR